MTSQYSDKIPPEFRQWILFLCRAIPIRSTLTFIELLLSALLSQNGFVTEAYSSIAIRNHWTSYYRWLQNGKWSWLALSRQFLRLLISVLQNDVVHLAIDDTLTLRSSHKVPNSQIHHQHGNTMPAMERRAQSHKKITRSQVYGPLGDYFRGIQASGTLA